MNIRSIASSVGLGAPKRAVAAQIRAALARAGRTQKDICAAAGLSQAYVSGLLSGHYGLSVGAALVIGRATGLDPRALLIAQLDEQIEAWQRYETAGAREADWQRDMECSR